ncbi:MAG: nitrous oxide reductase accessory protein NosL, partial [Cyclobacteriaceae bacterium]|nr:nitrous oxide reductase accessory protein NosL [Cyclobacteriaceae bacterium]
IVDARHAAQLVTDKGKQFKYDAIECMVLDMKGKGDVSVGLLAVGDYSNPGELIDAYKATFLISEGIPSPMGANLSAFLNKDSAENLHSQHGGNLYNWKEIFEYIEKQNK